MLDCLSGSDLSAYIWHLTTCIIWLTDSLDLIAYITCLNASLTAYITCMTASLTAFITCLTASLTAYISCLTASLSLNAWPYIIHSDRKGASTFVTSGSTTDGHIVSGTSGDKCGSTLSGTVASGSNQTQRLQSSCILIFCIMFFCDSLSYNRVEMEAVNHVMYGVKYIVE